MKALLTTKLFNDGWKTIVTSCIIENAKQSTV